MQNIGKRLGCYIAILFGAMVLGSVFLLAAYALPMGKIHQHINESLVVLNKEGKYPQECEGDLETQRDNFTDALMLDIAGFDNGKSLIERAFGNYYIASDKSNPILWLQLEDSDPQQEISYARYWHGYVVLLKACLLFFNYQEIRSLLYFLDLLLIGWLVVSFWRKGLKRYMIPLLITLMFFPLTVISKSLQFSTVFIPTLAGMILLLKKERSTEQYEGIFLGAGILIAFLDLLTYPLVNLGFLLCIMLLVYQDQDLIYKVKRVINCAVAWLVGYAGMWASKWLVSGIFLKTNVLQDAMTAAAFRTSNTNGKTTWTYYDVVIDNIKKCPKMVLFLFIIYAPFLVAQLIRKKYALCCSGDTIIWFAIAVLPFVWYLFLQNHSYMHVFFTHRNLSITCLAVLFGMGSIVKPIKAPLTGKQESI